MESFNGESGKVYAFVTWEMERAFKSSKKRQKKAPRGALKVFTLTKGAVELLKANYAEGSDLAFGFFQLFSARFLVSANVP